MYTYIYIYIYIFGRVSCVVAQSNSKPWQKLELLGCHLSLNTVTLLRTQPWSWAT